MIRINANFYVFGIFFLVLFSKSESLQYNTQYFSELVSQSNEQGIRDFFSTYPVGKKPKHIIEFLEKLRIDLEKQYGYELKWEDIYNGSKEQELLLGMKKKYRREVFELLNELKRQSKKSSSKNLRLNSFTMDYKGSMDPDIEISDGMVIAYCEALSGALLCIIPEPTSKIAAGILFGDAVTRTAAYLEQRSMETRAKQLERESNSGSEGRAEPNYDRDSWDKEY